MAERAGFEPAIPVTVCPLSKRVPSAAQPSLHSPSVLSRTVVFNCCLPFVSNVFGEADFVRDGDHSSVVERHVAVELPEHLVLVGH